MSVAIMQPYFFPYLPYWQLINSVDTFVIYDDVSFRKKSYITRNNILLNNTPYQINLELVKASQNKLIKDIIIYKKPEKLLKTIYHAYSKEKYFKAVYELIEHAIMQEEKRLNLFLGNIIKLICDYLKIKKSILYSSSIQKNNNLKGQDKIIDIVNILNKRVYINAIGGQDLYGFEFFKKHNITLKFIKSNQHSKNLSIIDLMMLNSIDAIQNYLLQFTLISEQSICKI